MQQGVSNALQSPSRYDLPQVQQVRDALTGQLQDQFNGQRKQLDEQMASRGLSASTIGSGAYHDLQGTQDNAMANLNASLIQNQAATSAGDLSASLGAGQNYQSGQLASQLGLGNLGISQQNANTAQTGTVGGLGIQAGGLTGNYNGQQTLGAQAQNLAQTLGLGNLGVAQGGLDLAKTANQQQYGLNQGALTGTYGGQQTLSAQEAAANNALGFGNLMGSVNGQQTLGGQQLSSQNSQFQQQLAQALGLAQMGNDTARYGIDTQAAANNNDMMMRVTQLLASMGYSPGNPAPGATTGTGTGGAGGNAGGGSTGGTGGTGGGTTGGGGGPVPEGGTGGGATPMSASRMLGAPSQAAPISTGTTRFGSPPNASASLSPNASPNTGQAIANGPTIPTPTPHQLPGTPNAPPTAQPSVQPYQTPMFGNSGYTGLFGNSPVQYAGAPAGQQNGSPGAYGTGGTNNVPLTQGSGSPGPAPGQAPGGTGDLASAVQAAMSGGGAPMDPSSLSAPNNMAAPGQSAASIFAQNGTANPNTGAGPLNIGGSSTGTDPMSLYRQGKITYDQLQKMAVAYQPGKTYAPGTMFGGLRDPNDTSPVYQGPYNPNNL